MALCLWACEPAPASPTATLEGVLPVPAQVEAASTAFMPPTLTRQAPGIASTQPVLPAQPPAVPTQTALPSASVDTSLVAQYDPWSLGHAVAWSASGDILAVSAGEAVYFYDGQKLQERGRIDLQAWGAGLAFSPVDDHLLAVAGRDGALQLWDVAQSERLATQAAHARGANSVAFSPDGVYLASTGNDAMVRLWQVAALLTGQPVQPHAVMIGGAVAVPAIRYSPDGLLIASIDLQVVRLRDPLTQRLVRTLRGESSMFSLAFSADGQWLAVGELGNQVRIWEVASGIEAMALQADAGSADPVRAFAWSLGFSPDGTLLAAGSSAGTLTIWTFPEGDVVKVVQAHARGVSGLAFDSQGQRVATCGLDAALRIWSLP